MKKPEWQPSVTTRCTRRVQDHSMNGETRDCGLPTTASNRCEEHRRLEASEIRNIIHDYDYLFARLEELDGDAARDAIEMRRGFGIKCQ